MASDLPPIAGITNVTGSFPLPDDFATPLVKIALDGENYYFNDTDQYAQLGTTVHDDKLGVALNTGLLETIHAITNCANKTETDYIVSLAENGKAQIKISHRYYGGEYNDKNRYFSELPPEERKHYFQETVSHFAQGARAVADLTTKFDTYPGLEEFTVEMDNYAVADRNYLYFDLPKLPSLFDFGAAQRSLPLYIADGSEKNVHTEIQWPAGYQETDIVPVSKNVMVDGGRAAVKREDSAGKCTVDYQLQTVPAIVGAKEYPALPGIQSILCKKSSTVFLLERK